MPANLISNICSFSYLLKIRINGGALNASSNLIAGLDIQMISMKTSKFYFSSESSELALKI